MITRRITSTTMATHRPSTTAVKWMEYIWNYANSKYRLNTADGDILNANTLVPCHTRKWVEYTWTCIAPHAQHSCRINRKFGHSVEICLHLIYVAHWTRHMLGKAHEVQMPDRVHVNLSNILCPTQARHSWRDSLMEVRGAFQKHLWALKSKSS